MDRLKYFSLIILAFALLVILLSFHTRELIRKQVISRDSKLIHLLIQMGPLLIEDGSFSGELPEWMLEDSVVTSVRVSEKIQGIVAVQLLDSRRNLKLSLPDNFIPPDLDPDDLKTINEHQNVSRFHSDIRLDSLFADPDFFVADFTVPLLEVIIPMVDSNSNQLEGITQIWIDGSSMSEELALLDRNLMLQSGIALFGGCLIIGLILYWAFKRLNRLNQVLMDRSLKLQEANQALVLAAKSSAIGAISAHLIHGLKNPLSGLQNYLSSQPQLESINTKDNDVEWHTAQETTRKMNRMLEEIVQILREERNETAFELSLNEIIQTVRNHAEDLTRSKKILLEFSIDADNHFSNRDGNLLILILDNLVKNAIEASPADKKVMLKAKEARSSIQIQIEDEGSGLPRYIQENLFSPCISSKPKGNGIGLAISQQLARHLNAELSLEYTSSSGTCFQLNVKH